MCASVQVGKAASKGSSVADKAGSAAKDIKGKNPFGEWGGWGGTQLPQNHPSLSCSQHKLVSPEHWLKTRLKISLLAGDLSGGLPGSNVSKDDLPDGPKPGQALKDLPSGSAGSQVSSQVCRHAGLLLAAAAQMLTIPACSCVAALHRVGLRGPGLTRHLL